MVNNLDGRSVSGFQINDPRQEKCSVPLSTVLWPKLKSQSKKGFIQ